MDQYAESKWALVRGRDVRTDTDVIVDTIEIGILDCESDCKAYEFRRHTHIQLSSAIVMA